MKNGVKKIERKDMKNDKTNSKKVDVRDGILLPLPRSSCVPTHRVQAVVFSHE